MKKIKPNKKVQSEIQKEVEDLFGTLKKPAVGYQGWKQNQKTELEKIASELYLVIILLMIASLLMAANTTVILLR